MRRQENRPLFRTPSRRIEGALDLDLSWRPDAKRRDAVLESGDSPVVTALLLHDFRNEPPYFDEPKPWVLTGSLKLPRRLSPSGKDQADFGHAGASSFEFSSALARFLGEAVERSALFPSPAPRLLRSFNGLGERGLDPNRVVAGTRIKTPDRRDLPFSWVRGIELPSSEPTLIPQQLVDVPYMFARGEAVLRSPITTGSAAGPSIEHCVFFGLCEIVERDSFMAAWLLNLPSIGSPMAALRNMARTAASRELANAVAEVSRYRLSVEFRELPSSTPLRVVTCGVFDETGVGPRVSVGAAASTDLARAALKSLEEALQIRSWLRADHTLRQKRTRSSRAESVNLRPLTIRDRARNLLHEKYAESVREWFSAPFPSRHVTQQPIALGQLIRAIRDSGGTVLIADLTSRLPRSIRALGFVAAKVVVPEYQPLYLSEPLRDLAWFRLRNTYSDGRILSAKDLNRHPHPFL